MNAVVPDQLDAAKRIQDTSFGEAYEALASRQVERMVEARFTARQYVDAAHLLLEQSPGPTVTVRLTDSRRHAEANDLYSY